MADINDCVRSLLPGRARLRHPMMHKMEAATISQVTSMIMAMPGVTKAEVNPRVGSLLIEWNEEETNGETILGTIEMYAAMNATADEKVEPVNETEVIASMPVANEKSCVLSDTAKSAVAGLKLPVDEACSLIKKIAEQPTVAKAGQVALNNAEKLEKEIVKVFASAAKTVMPEKAAKNVNRASRLLQNRTMLGVLGLSIAALGVKSTGTHIVAGGAFLALLGVHLLQHRRVL